MLNTDEYCLYFPPFVTYKYILQLLKRSVTLFRKVPNQTEVVQSC